MASSLLNIDKQPLSEDTEPMLKWTYNYPEIVGKELRVYFTTGFKVGDREVKRFPLQFSVVDCPLDCLGIWEESELVF